MGVGWPAAYRRRSQQGPINTTTENPWRDPRRTTGPLAFTARRPAYIASVATLSLILSGFLAVMYKAPYYAAYDLYPQRASFRFRIAYY